MAVGLFGAVTTLLLSGCSIANVKEFNEAAHTLPAEPVPMDPETIGRLKDIPTILAIHYDRYRNADVFHPSISGGPEELIRPVEEKAENPLPAVKERFLSAVREHVEIGNVRVIENPRFGRTVTDLFQYYWSPRKTIRDTKGDLEQLKRTFREGMAFDFYTHRWWLIPYPDDENLYRIVYTVEARLIDIEGSALYWKGLCNVVEDEPPERRPTLVGLASDDRALAARIDRAAEDCAVELVFQLLGETAPDLR